MIRHCGRSRFRINSEAVNIFIHLGRTPWMGDRPIARPLFTQDSTTQKCGRRKVIWKVRGLNLLRIGTLWTCSDDLFFEVPPLASDALLTTLHPLLENVLQTVDFLEISCLGAPLMVGKAQKSDRARSGLYGGCSNGVPPIHLFASRTKNSIQISPHAISELFQPWKGAPRQEISKWSTIYNTFSRSGWSVVRSASLAKGGTSKKETVTAPP
jgi:hypothetical protein